MSTLNKSLFAVLFLSFSACGENVSNIASDNDKAEKQDELIGTWSSCAAGSKFGEKYIFKSGSAFEYFYAIECSGSSASSAMFLAPVIGDDSQISKEDLAKIAKDPIKGTYKTEVKNSDKKLLLETAPTKDAPNGNKDELIYKFEGGKLILSRSYGTFTAKPITFVKEGSSTSSSSSSSTPSSESGSKSDPSTSSSKKESDPSTSSSKKESDSKIRIIE